MNPGARHDCRVGLTILTPEAKYQSIVTATVPIYRAGATAYRELMKTSCLSVLRCNELWCDFDELCLEFALWTLSGH